MIIWINGAFGAGKTTLAHVLEVNVENVVIFDPEDIGTLIRKMNLLVSCEDYQDASIWRDLVVECIKCLDQSYPHRMIAVPMSIIEKQYVEEIFDRLKSFQINVKHFWLKNSQETLISRIENQTFFDDPAINEKIMKWRLGHINRCLQAEGSLPKEVIILDGEGNPDKVLESLIKHL